MASALLSLGSNIEPRLKYLALALKRLNQGPLRLTAVSHLFETGAVDVREQPDFLNLAVSVDTALSAVDLLDYCRGIEAEAGKKTILRRGPRTLDIDLLMVDAAVLESAELSLPHPRMHERAFVLAPLAQIAPEAVHPVLKRKIVELWEGCSGEQQIRDLGEFSGAAE